MFGSGGIGGPGGFAVAASGDGARGHAGLLWSSGGAGGAGAFSVSGPPVPVDMVVTPAG
ncbi:hypothetical protein MMRN_12410 [Mycobacterium marinum]|nr:hypothetical protein MMRN_12410 [Mycobacterium marinum]